MTGRPARWLVLATHVPPSGGGGMARVAVELCRHLNRHPAVELHALVRPEAVERFATELGVPRQRVHAGPYRDALVQSLRELGGVGLPVDLASFDVVHGTKHIVPLRGTRNARIVLTVHDFIMLDRPQDFPPAKRFLLGRPYEMSLRRAAVLATVSAATRARLTAFAPDLAAKAVTVPLAVSDSLLRASPVPLPALDGSPFALVVGDLSPRKNVRFVAQLWPEVASQVPGARLAVVGPPGWGRDEGRNELHELAEAGQAVHLGHVSEGELRWAYEHAAVTLCPSLLEGFGLPAAEARAFGCPVLASPDPALQEAAGGGTPIPLTDRAGWVERIVSHLKGADGAPGAAGCPVRTWADVASELVGAVLAPAPIR